MLLNFTINFTNRVPDVLPHCTVTKLFFYFSFVLISTLSLKQKSKPENCEQPLHEKNQDWKYYSDNMANAKRSYLLVIKK